MPNPPRPLTSNRLLICILMNQLATPGLGSWMARRKVAGAGQLALALAGCFLVVFWTCRLAYDVTMEEIDQLGAQKPENWVMILGLILFGASWVWALVTSVGLWRQARELQKAERASLPPKLP